MALRRIKWWLVLVSIAILAGCADDGSVLKVCHNRDLNCDDSNACTLDSCDPASGCVNERISCDDGDACTADSCDAASGCVNTTISCNDGDQCTADSCDVSTGCVSTDISASCDDGNACTADSCDMAVGCVNATVNCDDGNECTAESCDPATGCDSSPVGDGTSCDRGLGQCIGVICEPVACFEDAGCNDSDACTMDSCNLATNECVNTDISASCDDDDACTEDSCAPATGCVNTDISASCDDGDECTADICAPATGCGSEPVENGTPCDGGAGVCSAGTCRSTDVVEYMQDFESLDQMNTEALANDGWVVFGNVYDGTTMDFLYGYGPFIAPNDGAAFSAIVVGQGGHEQGNQQLSVYSDYNNTDHADGDLIESNVFRERNITTADVGRTISFSFDAKRGNINDPTDSLCPCTSTAFAFVKTLDPMAGFSTTNFVTEDTTTLPDTWAGYVISLPIDVGLVGQLLQVGFSSTATLYQPSANFYDNIELHSAVTVP
jgi:hypothetical protein